MFSDVVRNRPGEGSRYKNTAPGVFGYAKEQAHGETSKKDRKKPAERKYDRPPTPLTIYLNLLASHLLGGGMKEEVPGGFRTCFYKRRTT